MVLKSIKSGLLSGSQKGQAVFEYVLMVIVTLSLIIGLATHFITPLRDYLQNYAGTYIECLLETGELPFIIASTESQECDFDELKARIDEATAGGDSSGGTPGNASTDGSNGDSSDNNSNNSNQNANNNANAGGGSGGGGGSSLGGPRLNQSGGLNEGATSGFNSGGGDGSSRGGKLAARVKRANAEAANATGSNNTIPYKYEQDYGRGLSGVLPVERTEEETELQSIRQNQVTKKSSKKEAEQQLRKKDFTVKPPPKQKTAGQNQEDFSLGLNFGKYMRYFLIGGIIFALIIMVFTQLNNLRKGWTQ